jgi:plasmid stabilization system protein ParE
LETENPQASLRAAQAIERQLFLLETEPQIGRPLNDLPQLRELIIPFGDSGYVALYHYDLSRSEVCILAFRHQKQAGF